MNPHNPSILDFYEFIYDRQMIWHKRFVLNRARGINNWTTDPILQKFRFCNVYRELDACTIHLIENVHKDIRLNLQDAILNIIMYRRFNTPNFFSAYPLISARNFPFKFLEKKMDKEKAKGNVLFNDAYIVCQRWTDQTYRPKDKHVQQLLLIKGLAEDKDFIPGFLECNSYEEAHKYLVDSIPNTGGFSAQQYLIDITYLDGFSRLELSKCNWNINSFVSVGPGAKPALRMLFSEIPKWGNSLYSKHCCLLAEIQGLMFKELKAKRKKDWNKIYYKESIAGGKYLRLSDIQNCLCEFRKYCHLQTNPNKKKRYYKGAK